MSDYTRLRILRWEMILINFAILLAYGSLRIISTYYAKIHHTAAACLSLMGQAPWNVWASFACLIIVSLLLFSYLLFIKTEGLTGTGLIIPMILAAILIVMIDGAYNGLVLTVFCFFISGEKMIKAPWKSILLCLAIFVLTQSEVIRTILILPDPEGMIQVFSPEIRSSFTLSLSLAKAGSMVVFIVYVSVFLLDQYKRNSIIESELEMVTEVNTKLQDYAAITEKIGEDKERKRLAREIHDTLGHALTGISAGVDACLVLIDLNPEAAKAQLAVVSKVVKQGIFDVRNSLNKLRPGALEQNSFQFALEKMIQEFMDVSSMKISFNYHLEDYDFDGAKEDSMFRMVQECITNSLRHGGASAVWISMYSDNGKIILSIRDNGKGCPDIKPGYGIKQMRERAALLGGSVVTSGDDGFITIISFPEQEGELRKEGQK